MNALWNSPEIRAKVFEEMPLEEKERTCAMHRQHMKNKREHRALEIFRDIQKAAQSQNGQAGGEVLQAGVCGA